MGQEPDPTPDPNDDPTPEPAPDPEPDPKPDPVDGLDEAALRAELKKTREEAARHRIAARDAAARAKEFEDRDKSEAEKLKERAETAEKDLATAQRNAMVAEVALDKGLTGAQAKRLIGTTKEELEADADELLSTFKPSSDGGQDSPTRGTRERLRPGAVPSAEEEETDPRKLAAQVPRRY